MKNSFGWPRLCEEHLATIADEVDMMAKRFKTLLDEMSPDRQARIRSRTDELLATLPLSDLRKARTLSQQEMGDLLDVNQATISKLERRTDMYLSTMRRFVRAMGGELEIRARFPEGVVEIDQFGTMASPEGQPSGRKSAKGRSKKK